MKYSLILLSMFFVSPGYSMSHEQGKTNQKPANQGSKTIDIATDLPPSAEAEKVMPTHPAFSESTAFQLMERLQDLEDRVEKLEKAGEAKKKERQ